MQWRLLSGEGGFERQSRRTKLHKIHSCFRATDLVTWILCDLGLQSRTEVRLHLSLSLLVLRGERVVRSSQRGTDALALACLWLRRRRSDAT
jgi:hypothetical protein